MSNDEKKEAAEMGPGCSISEGVIWSVALTSTSSGLYYYLGLGVLVAMMVWGAILAHRAWEEANEDLDPASPEELLDVFEQARAEGELDESEFARVRHRLEEKEGS